MIEFMNFETTKSLNLGSGLTSRLSALCRRDMWFPSTDKTGDRVPRHRCPNDGGGLNGEPRATTGGSAVPAPRANFEVT
jgi:hypothetical protein